MSRVDTIALLASAGFRTPREVLHKQLETLVRERATPTETLSRACESEDGAFSASRESRGAPRS